MTEPWEGFWLFGFRLGLSRPAGSTLAAEQLRQADASPEKAGRADPQQIAPRDAVTERTMHDACPRNASRGSCFLLCKKSNRFSRQIPRAPFNLAQTLK